MKNALSQPKFFAEITCPTSPHPLRKGTAEVPRVGLSNVDIKAHVSFGNREVNDHGEFPRFRELELLVGYKGYDIKKSDDNRWFISFNHVYFTEAQAFIHYANVEIRRVNRVIAALLISTSSIEVENVVYQINSNGKLEQVWQEPEAISGALNFHIVEEVDLLEKWNAIIREISGDGRERLFRLFEREQKDPMLTTCIQLVSENSFPSFYKAYEILSQHYGGHHKFLRLGLVDKKTVSCFTENAQVYRHADHKLRLRLMPLAEAKLFILTILNYYETNPKGVRR